MDEFRVGSTSPLDAYADRDQTGERKRKNRPQTPAVTDEDQVLLSGDDKNAGESVEDFYSPSEASEETEADT